MTNLRWKFGMIKSILMGKPFGRPKKDKTKRGSEEWKKKIIEGEWHNEKISENQINFLKKLNYQGDFNLTKGEAQIKIIELLKK